ncbi:MAG: insulinase family protein [Bacteriovoracaceae bacterium]|nr:insulinase family protein [Bacteriovoracaceae bacterium]
MNSKKILLLPLLILIFIKGCSTVSQKIPEDSSNIASVTGLSKHSKKESVPKNLINIKVTKKVLPNGLTVLITENHKLPIFSCYILYDVGGRHERKGMTGASHFLEHMMFKGAKKYGPGEFDHIIEGNGGTNNAYTSFDQTVYHENLPISLFEKTIDLEADRMVNLLLDPVAFEKERQVVLEERKLRNENNPRGKLYLSMTKSIFENTPYGGSVIGDLEDVKALSRSEVLKFFSKFYAPNNAILVISGDVDTEQALATIEKKFGPLKMSTSLSATKIEVEDTALYTPHGRYKREIKLHGQTPSPFFMLAYRGPKLGERRSQVLDILSSILGDGNSSHLYQKYVLGKSPLLSQFYAYNKTMKHSGVFFMGGDLLKKTNLAQFKRRLLKDTRLACKEAITERSLQKTKNQYLISYFNAIQTNSGMAHFLGLNERFYGDYSYYIKELEIYNSITTEEVKNACHELFDDGKYIFLSIWDKNPKQKTRKNSGS